MKKNKTYLLAAAAIAIPFLQASCATTVNWIKGGQLVSFDSEPRGAEIYIDGELRGKTPAHIKLRPRKQSSLIIKKAGFADEIKPLKTEFNLVFFGNILSGGLLGSTTDAATDNTWQYSPTEYFIQLKPAEATPEESAAWMDRLNRRNFIFSSYKQLVRGVAIGKGEYYSAFCDVAKLDCTNKVAKDLKFIALSSKDPREFSLMLEKRFYESK